MFMESRKTVQIRGRNRDPENGRVATGQGGEGGKNLESRIDIDTLLLLLSHFSRVQLCDPIDGSPPGSPSCVK